MYCGLFESELVSTPIGPGNPSAQARNRFPGLQFPCPIAKVH
jgi:hypothetical protein